MNPTIEDQTTSTIENRNYYLFRSDRGISLKTNVVGYGWGDIHFCDYPDAKGIIEKIGKHIGRKSNQIRRFKAIKRGDIIVVPHNGTIVIGEAIGEELYDPSAPADGKNQHRVNFPLDEKSEVLVVPRYRISEGLQRRLKIRSSLTNMSGFKMEIDRIYEDLKAGLAHDYSANVAQRSQDLKDKNKKQLLENIRTGNTGLKSGGAGLESLVKELLKIDGFVNTETISKKAFPGSKADADIETSRTDRLSLNDLEYLVQVKHHNGSTSDWGIRQLEMIAASEKALVYSNHKLVLVTSGIVSEADKAAAESKEIKIIDGPELIDWIWDSIPNLSTETKLALRIAEGPQIIG